MVQLPEFQTQHRLVSRSSRHLAVNVSATILHDLTFLDKCGIQVENLVT
ncbi:MAG: hypothetical protein DDT32_01614 [Syntrophomonadaceae bacterium]|nr:hypothetical protein [Bacillota bacterium]